MTIEIQQKKFNKFPVYYSVQHQTWLRFSFIPSNFDFDIFFVCCKLRIIWHLYTHHPQYSISQTWQNILQKRQRNKKPYKEFSKYFQVSLGFYEVVLATDTIHFKHPSPFFLSIFFLFILRYFYFYLCSDNKDEYIL